jgi:lysyl-tRNA synthetase class 2
VNFWQPSAEFVTLQARANFMSKIRQFFATRNITEVETPILSQGTVTDVHLNVFSTQYLGARSSQQCTLYLQTSPEYAMKRMLCAGSGDIYQIAKAFRNEQSGRLHNPEFTLLEWYRLGWNDEQLMDEIDQFMQYILQTEPAEIISYQQVFLRFTQLDPLDCSLKQLQEYCVAKGFAQLAREERDKDVLLQLLFSHQIEPYLGEHRHCFVTDFPATQSALARINKDDPRVAKRFELYFKGLELANGYHELTDADEHAKRFKSDNLVRKSKGKPQRPIDRQFMTALESGLPDCAGVALGIDRLFMLERQAKHIRDVLAFDADRA